MSWKIWTPTVKLIDISPINISRRKRASERMPSFSVFGNLFRSRRCSEKAASRCRLNAGGECSGLMQASSII